MSSVQVHYDQFLGPLYSWMSGGAGPAIERGAAELKGIGITRSTGRLAVDLGAGFGVHAIPLARLGFNVLALDSCAVLLSELETRKGELPIEAVQADLCSFPLWLARKPGLVLCMGDTITHLVDEEAVAAVIQTVSAELVVGGRFVLTFRDYSIPLTAERRFIPVRTADRRILTCFLDYTASHVQVHDLLQEWDGSGWRLSVSVYQKLRIPPRWIAGVLRENGFTVEKRTCVSGMVCLVAHRH